MRWPKAWFFPENNCWTLKQISKSRSCLAWIIMLNVGEFFLPPRQCAMQSSFHKQLPELYLSSAQREAKYTIAAPQPGRFCIVWHCEILNCSELQQKRTCLRNISSLWPTSDIQHATREDMYGRAMLRFWLVRILGSPNLGIGCSICSQQGRSCWFSVS